MTDEDLLKRITTDPEKLGGKPIIRGRRIAATMVLRLSANGQTRAEILDSYPALEAEDIDACLVFAAQRGEDAKPLAAAAACSSERASLNSAPNSDRSSIPI
jgi:uncharacterized protein (DUF433 family)